ncbi:MAG: hypothetical protein IJC66_04790, partial [Kiritimatiellae bacterium]|nr:hypothetical protein [Kiritimatiellia bacterium]
MNTLDDLSKLFFDLLHPLPPLHIISRQAAPSARPVELIAQKPRAILLPHPLVNNIFFPRGRT